MSINRFMHQGIRSLGVIGILASAPAALAASIELETAKSAVKFQRTTEDKSTGDLTIEKHAQGEWKTAFTLKSRQTSAVQLDAWTLYRLSFDTKSLKRTIPCQILVHGEQATALTLSSGLLGWNPSVENITKGQTNFKVENGRIKMLR